MTTCTHAHRHPDPWMPLTALDAANGAASLCLPLAGRRSGRGGGIRLLSISYSLAGRGSGQPRIEDQPKKRRKKK